MLIAVTIVAVLLVCAAVGMFVAGRIEGLAPAPADREFQGLGEPVTAAEVDTVVFSTAVRGYRMAEVDQVLAQVAQRLRSLDEELAGLRPPGSCEPLADAQVGGVDQAPGAVRDNDRDVTV